MPAPSRVPLLCLASASPRRRELLGQLGVPHVVAVPNIDEAVLAGAGVTYWLDADRGGAAR